MKRKSQTEMPMMLVWLILGLIGLAIVVVLALQGKDLFKTVIG